MNYDIFDHFVKNYEGLKLALIVTGGGLGIHNLAVTLGASRVLHTIYVPYSYKESERFISNALDSTCGKQYTEGAVSQYGAQLLCLAGQVNWPDCRVVACTAATTTSRYRRGENQAFIATIDPEQKPENIKQFHLKLSKISESDHQMMGLGYASWKRRAEDLEITKYLLKIANGEVK